MSEQFSKSFDWLLAVGVKIHCSIVLLSPALYSPLSLIINFMSFFIKQVIFISVDLISKIYEPLLFLVILKLIWILNDQTFIWIIYVLSLFLKGSTDFNLKVLKINIYFSIQIFAANVTSNCIPATNSHKFLNSIPLS